MLYTVAYILQLSIFISANGIYASQVRNHYSQINQEAHLERALSQENSQSLFSIKCIPSNLLLSYLILRMSNSPDVMYAARWRYGSGDWGWRMWGHLIAQIVIQHWRVYSEWASTGCCTSWQGMPGRSFANYNHSTAEESLLCRRRHCTPYTSTVLKFSSGSATDNIQMQIVNPPQQTMPVWLCNCPGAPTTQVYWRSECSTNKGQWRLEYSNQKPVVIRIYPNTKRLLLKE